MERNQHEFSALIPAAIVDDEIVPAGRPWGRVIERGQTLRIVDMHGQQAVDFLCFDAADPTDRYNAANTLKVRGTAYIERGMKLYSDAGNPLFTITAILTLALGVGGTTAIFSLIHTVMLRSLPVADPVRLPDAFARPLS